MGPGAVRTVEAWTMAEAGSGWSREFGCPVRQSLCIPSGAVPARPRISAETQYCARGRVGICRFSRSARKISVSPNPDLTPGRIGEKTALESGRARCAAIRALQRTYLYPLLISAGNCGGATGGEDS